MVDQEAIPKDEHANGEGRVTIIRAVTSPLAFFTLVLLVSEGTFGVMYYRTGSEEELNRTLLISGAMAVLLVLIVVMTYLTIRHRGKIDKRPPRPIAGKREIKARADKMLGKIFEVEKSFSPDAWYRKLQPTLYQASYYGAPTYYLDENLNIVDWNVAFELVFSRSVGRLRNNNVRFLIAEFANFDEVARHGAKFTKRKLEGHTPYVDTEPITYISDNYGSVSFLKVAVQLHDEDGILQGWAVSLFVKSIAWDEFEKDLRDRIAQDKLWGVYSAPYDRVLNSYPPYHDLTKDVLSIVPAGASSVADLGAGTGNAARELINRGHKVTAVENNLGMLNGLRAKQLPRDMITVVKSTAEELGMLKDASFDAVIMVNSLYAIDSPLACLYEINRILRPAGVVGVSVTHSKINLTPLLNDIERTLRDAGRFPELADDYEIVKEINHEIQKDIGIRFTVEQYVDWLETAGFEVIGEPRSTYQDAVVVIHARKGEKPVAAS